MTRIVKMARTTNAAANAIAIHFQGLFIGSVCLNERLTASG